MSRPPRGPPFMRSLLYVVTGCALLLLGPRVALTQPPAGGFDRQRGEGGGRRGGGFGGFNRDPNEAFNRMTNGKDVWIRSEITDPMRQGFFDRIAQSVGATNGQITREQFATGMQ